MCLLFWMIWIPNPRETTTGPCKYVVNMKEIAAVTNLDQSIHPRPRPRPLTPPFVLNTRSWRWAG